MVVFVPYRGWESMSHFRHRIVIPRQVEASEGERMNDWVRESGNGLFTCLWTPSPTPPENHTLFAFSDSDTALHFRLKFGGRAYTAE
jgi:hypothetical protein